MALLLTKKELIALLSSFIFCCFTTYFTRVAFLLWVISFLSFCFKRKEIYFLWSLIAPRITGNAPILEHLLAIAREEGPGNKQLNDVMTLDIPFAPRVFFVFKDSYIKKILATDAVQFSTSGYQGPLKNITNNSGNNVLLCDGAPNPHWRRYRNATSHVNRDRFGEGSLLAQMCNTSWTALQEIVPQHFSKENATGLSLFEELFEIMIPAHNRALFGDEFANKYQYKEMSREVYEVITEAGTQLLLGKDFCPPWKKANYTSQYNRITEAVHNMMKESTSPFMKPLLEARREGRLSEEELLSNLMVFEYAQAPLHVVFWLLQLLSMHPEEEKKVVEEIALVLSQGPLTHARLSEFTYLSKVVMETMRLYPGVALLQVRTAKNDTMLDEHVVPKGSMLFMCTYLIHRNATYWTNPDEFNPSREGLDAANYGKNFAYIPFGNGPRQCQGQYFAIDFVKLTVISILQHFKLSLVPGQQPAIPTEKAYLMPVRPLFVHFTKRALPQITLCKERDA